MRFARKDSNAENSKSDAIILNFGSLDFYM